jgi:hypothetical protein
MLKDIVAKRIWYSLYKDFSTVDTSVELFAAGAARALGKGFSEFRKHSFPELDHSLSVGAYKKCTQLEHLFDRFIADSDDKTQADLDTEAYDNFLSGQANVISKLPRSTRAHMLLKEVRRVLSLILGELPPISELVEYRIPSKASVGVKRKDSYLHEKLNHLSSTAEQHRYLKALLGDCGFRYNAVAYDHLTVTAVEKKWNKSRTITTDTVASGMLTNAIGNVISKRLIASVGIDIRKQQHVHRKLVKRASRDGKLATLDLSAASDSFSIPLMRRILPSRWFRVLRALRIQRVSVNNEVTSLNSFMTMGLGHTFPLQTAVFYAIIQSTKNLLRSTSPYAHGGIISVYGDDCVFPTSLYPFVVACFEDLGFKVNTDKSFSTGMFRESCGEDCFKGCSVRPAFLKWRFQQEVIVRKRKVKVDQVTGELYAFWNALLRRFHATEIPRTYRLLESMINYVDGEVFIVPPTYPDFAGLHVINPKSFTKNYGIKYYDPSFFDLDDGNGYYEFACLKAKAPRAVPVTKDNDVYNYLMEQLRPRSEKKPFEQGFMLESHTFVSGTFNSLTDRQSVWGLIKQKNTSVMRRRGEAKLRKGATQKLLALFSPGKPPSNVPRFLRSYGLEPWWSSEDGVDRHTV